MDFEQSLFVVYSPNCVKLTTMDGKMVQRLILLVVVCVLLARTVRAQDDLFLFLLNQARIEWNVPTVFNDATLQRAAQSQADHIATVAEMTHSGPDGSSIIERMQRLGYDGNVSQIVYSNDNPDDTAAINTLLTSPDHAAVLLGDFREIGIARVESPINDVTYWCIILGTPSGLIVNDVSPTAVPPAVNEVNEVNVAPVESVVESSAPIIAPPESPASSGGLSPYMLIIAFLALAGAGFLVYLAYQPAVPRQDPFRRR